MSFNLNAILVILTVSFLGAFKSNIEAAELTWYDSEGRPLVVKGREVKRKAGEEFIIADKKVAENISPAPIIAPRSTLRTDLSSASYNNKSFYRYSFYRPNSYRRGHSFFNRSYRGNHVYSNRYRYSYRRNYLPLRRSYYVR